MANNLYYGRGKDEDNKKLIKFIDEVFFTNDVHGRDFLNLLPKCYKDQYRPAYNNFVVQDENGTFRAAIGSFYNDMTVGGEYIKACCIGNVAVGKEYRSMGYMIELMEMSVEDMRKNGVDVAYLGGQRQRYGYFGFESSGTVLKYGFSRNAYRHSLKAIPSGFEIEELKADDTQSIAEIDKLYSRLPVRSNRKPESYFDVLCSWRNIPYILKKDGEFVGYFILNDTKENVAEFDVSDPAYFPNLVAAVMEKTESYNMVFRVAPFETEKRKFFDENADGFSINGCEMILVYDFEKFIRASFNAKSSYAKLCDGVMTVLIHGKYGDEKLKIEVKNNEVKVEKFDGEAEFEMDHNKATRVFFSNLEADRAELPANIQQWFPLHVFLSPSDTM
ncbi:MAG: GNAT family N-acetyltransferase [Clostridiaceae bacterium]|nr:GNAT family N-acetyltransferase [Clostridiaceae bacterium]